MSELLRNSISQTFSSSFNSLWGLPRFCCKLIQSLYFVANLCMISAFLWGLLGKWESVLERLRCKVCLHENAGPGVWVDISSWARTSALTASRTINSFSLFLAAHFLNLSFSLNLSQRSLFCFLLVLYFASLSFSLLKNSLDLAFSFSCRNLHFLALVNPEYSPFLGRPKRKV